MIPQMKTYIFLLMFSFVAKCHQSMLTQFDPASGKTLWPRGAIMTPLVFFQLWSYQKPKIEPLHKFGTKNNRKSHFGQF